METSLLAADEISLVSVSKSSSSGTGSSPRTPALLNSQSCNYRCVLFLVALLAVVCLILLSFIIVILIILLHQQTAVSSLGNRLHAVQHSSRQLEEGLMHISKALLLQQEKPDLKRMMCCQVGSKATTDTTTDGQHKNSEFFNGPLNLNFSKTDDWNNIFNALVEFEDIKTNLQGMNEKLAVIVLYLKRTRVDKEGSYVSTDLLRNISNQILMDTVSYLSNNSKKEPCNVTSMITWETIKREIQDVNNNLFSLLASLNETTVDREIRYERVDVLKNIANQSLMDTLSHVSNIVKNERWNATLIKKWEDNVMGFMASVDTNIKQLNNSLNGIEHDLAVLDEKVDSFESLLHHTCTRNRTTNETVTSEAGRLAFKDSQLIEKIENITEVQLPALFHFQVKILNELNEHFPLIRDQFNRSDGKRTEKKDFYDMATFCSNDHTCSSFNVNLKHCYRVSGPSEPLLTWEQARQKCQELGAYLLEINSNLELGALEHLVDSQQKYWLGGTDAEKEGLWIWQQSRRPIVLSIWTRGEPNNLRSEHCLQSVNGIRSWNDVPCSRKYRYICERNDGRCWE